MTTILIVEDEGPVLELLKFILTPQYQVAKAGNAALAIELARFLKPDLVVLDLNLEMPHDGLKVCRTLRSEPDIALAKIPILILTAATTEEDINAALEAGADHYLSKPYNPNVLRELIGHLLANRAGTEQIELVSTSLQTLK
ncbi:MAG: response regulator [Anaerolineae bacterium]|nr:response regulator [Anaerolineae bacterium]